MPAKHGTRSNVVGNLSHSVEAVRPACSGPALATGAVDNVGMWKTPVPKQASQNSLQGELGSRVGVGRHWTLALPWIKVQCCGSSVSNELFSLGFGVKTLEYTS